MNVSSAAIPARQEVRPPQLVAPAEVSEFAEPERPRSRLPGVLISITLGLGLWGGIAMLILG